MGTISTNLGLQIPTVAADADTWGDQLNFSLTTIDAVFQSGGTAISLGDVTTDDLAYTGSLTGSTGIINIGSGQIYKDVGGNVGIGTATPTRRLHISGGAIRLDSAQEIRFGDANVSSITGVDGIGTGYLSFATAGVGNRMLIDSAGNVGIGTNAPVAVGTRTTVNVKGADGSAIRLSDDTGNLFLDYTDGTGGRLNVNAAEPLTFGTNSLERLRIDSAGNAGLGVVPSAWGNGARALQIGSVGSVFQNPAGSVLVGRNHYVDATNASIYSTTGFATRYFQNAVGDHSWSVAPSGTAGSPITFTQAMTLTNGGNLLVGGTVDDGTRLQIQSNTSQILSLYNSVAGGTTRLRFLGLNGAGNTNTVADIILGNESAANASTYLAFTTRDSGGTITERARITSGGYFKASNTGTYISATGAFHEFVSNDPSETIIVDTASDTSICIHGRVPATSTGTIYVGEKTGVGVVFRVLHNGDVQNTNGVYGQIASDARLKENVTPATSKLDDIMQLEVVNFNYIDNEEKQLGFIAQDFQKVFPSLVTVNDTREYDEEGNVTKGLEDQLGLKVGLEFAFLVKALQEANAKIESLEARLNAAGL